MPSEVKIRKKMEKALERETHKLNSMTSKLEEVRELSTIEGQKRELEIQIFDSKDMEKELEVKLVSFVELMKTMKEERGRLELARDEAITQATELMISRVKASSSQDPQFLSDFSILEIEEATHRFDQSLIIGGENGSVYRGFLRSTVVPIKMLQSNSLEGCPKFQVEVNHIDGFEFFSLHLWWFRGRLTEEVMLWFCEPVVDLLGARIWARLGVVVVVVVIARCRVIIVDVGVIVLPVVDISSRMRHPNLFPLIGAYLKASTPFYDCLSNGSLEDRLGCNDGTPPLSWQTRIRISIEACSTLILIDSNNPKSIIHGDLKPVTILLDANLTFKLSESVGALSIEELQCKYSMQDVADSCRTRAATNVIFGLALGYKSIIIPIFAIALSIFTGKIAEMAGMSHRVHERTDVLDAVGNTTTAIGKGQYWNPHPGMTSLQRLLEPESPGVPSQRFHWGKQRAPKKAAPQVGESTQPEIPISIETRDRTILTRRELFHVEGELETFDFPVSLLRLNPSPIYSFTPFSVLPQSLEMGDANDNENGQRPVQIPLKDHMFPKMTNHASCIILPPTTGQFELRNALINSLPKFSGGEDENPYAHVRYFDDLMFHQKYRNKNKMEAMKLVLFPFSLLGKAKSWLQALRPKSITSFEMLTDAFYNKFFSLEKTETLRRAILRITQLHGDNLKDYLERYKGLILQCSHHGIDSWVLTRNIYDGLDAETKKTIESFCLGKFTDKDDVEDLDFSEEMAKKLQTEGTMRETDIQEKGGNAFGVGSNSNSEAKLTTILRKIES
ncbi:hypothetical protein GIB67_035362 [Kingdonia uniflora]|uniref:Retrotransposon gag domain-containing protein n=1 Tax=Kingdonia uniflora TaxID=39325 RepID=A0A7J7MM36_9MAGN|nr:hypothetical protein GIB67_035362 [Kingdonia uniflora]